MFNPNASDYVMNISPNEYALPFHKAYSLRSSDSRRHTYSFDIPMGYGFNFNSQMMNQIGNEFKINSDNLNMGLNRNPVTKSRLSSVDLNNYLQ